MSLASLAQRLPRLWYRRQLAVALLPLLPVSWLFRLLVGMRRTLYRCALLRSYRLPVPVIVIGNLTVGGSGKTPLVLWLVERLRAAGWRPGVISRGYGGGVAGALWVATDADPSQVGDEPLLLARRSGVPVFVGRDRVQTGRSLLAAHPECNVIVSDDGLQHYRLQRAVEIAVFDARGVGNSQLLPAGPLREPLRRLSEVSAVVWNSVTPASQASSQLGCTTRGLPQFSMQLSGQRFYSLSDRQCYCDVQKLRDKRLYALAGIGDPSRFFAQLKALGLEFEARSFPDHHRYSAADLVFANDGVLLMTEKDAVKCASLTAREAWVLPVDAQLAASADGKSLLDTILEKIDGRTIA